MVPELLRDLFRPNAEEQGAATVLQRIVKPVGEIHRMCPPPASLFTFLRNAPSAAQISDCNLHDYAVNGLSVRTSPSSVFLRYPCCTRTPMRCGSSPLGSSLGFSENNRRNAAVLFRFAMAAALLYFLTARNAARVPFRGRPRRRTASRRKACVSSGDEVCRFFVVASVSRRPSVVWMAFAADWW